ncbi:MAG: hypothetical protein CBB99_00875 [Bacteroidetes bacterium TMED39]|nr:MAG: hypothetical protein CBB99_00875 [Bacteroidetes bacterium TMED39]
MTSKLKQKSPVVLLILAMLLTKISLAQMDPYYSHFNFNRQAYNPAAAGEKIDYICVNGLYHRQWLNYSDLTPERGDEGQQGTAVENIAPETVNINIGYPFRLKNGDYLGLGVLLMDDKVSFLQNTGFKAQANYQKELQGGFSSISLGAEFGLNQFGYNEPNYISRDQGDVRIPVTGGSQGKLDVGAGIYYRQKTLGSFGQDFYAGFSATHLTQQTYDLTLTYQDNGQRAEQFNFVMHWYLLAGVDIPLSGGVYVLDPAILVKNRARPQVDLSATVLYNGTFRGGIGYRQWGTVDALTFKLGYVKNQLQVGYSFDKTLSSITQVSNGTHELMLKYCFQLQTEFAQTKDYKLSPRFL